jgi:D-alanyl-lipoteichoic acid acyltransferase DltB (MBOAT superfamily)
MLFPTIQFGIFFPIVFLCSWLLRPYPTRWKLFMILASYVFYGWWDWRFCFLLAASTIANQIFVAGICATRGVLKRAVLTLAVVSNLGVLAYFKYYDFFRTSIVDGLDKLGVHVSTPLLEIVLPVGISFFTFQALSYVIDAFRGKVLTAPFLDFAVYLSFFPHLVAGPIVRASEFLPQLKEKADPRHLDSSRALRLIMGGLFKKVVVSSFLASAIVDPVFGAPRAHSGLEALFATYSYAIQIYADFSGYTDIAIGCALLLGIRFPPNFNAPYTARSLQDFWRRWHMTLSRFLRDYLYVALGGNRNGRLATYRNLMLTMLIGGLWHGASWTFVVWGAIHGCGMAFERYLADRRERLGLPEPADTFARRAGHTLLTFHVVCLGWIFFRASGQFSIAFDMLHQLVTGWGRASPLVTPLVILTIGGMLLCQFVPEGFMKTVQARFSYLPVVAQGIALAIGFFLIDALGPVGVAPFIYFQF